MTKTTLVFRILPPSSGAVGGVLPDCGGDGISASQAQNQRSLPHPHPAFQGGGKCGALVHSAKR